MSVASTLETLRVQGPEYPLPSAEAIAELRAEIDHAVTNAQQSYGIPDNRAPIRLPKGRLTIASRCGRQLAGADDPIDPSLALLGSAVDTEAALIVLRSKQAGDPWQNAVDIWKANDDRDRLDLIDALAANERTELADLVRDRTVGLTEALGGFEPGWWPRAQDRVSVEVGGGRVVLSGIFDLFVGGGRSERPGVIIEVKAGSWWKGNDDDARFYALLAALRDGVSPAMVITVTAGDAKVMPEPIRLATLENAVERIERVLDNVYEIASGSVPDPTNGMWCDRCAVRSGCPAIAGSANTDTNTPVVGL